MKFVDKQNSNETVLGARIEFTNGGCRVRWSYPIEYNRVCIFEIPLHESFNEEKALRDGYVKHIIESPTQSLEVSQIINFAIFPINKNDELVRQNEDTHYCKIDVVYAITEEQEIVKATGFAGYFKKAEKIIHKKLKISSPISLPGDSFLYRLNDNSVFCLPFNIEGGRPYIMEINENLELFTEKKFINLKRHNS